MIASGGESAFLAATFLRTGRFPSEVLALSAGERAFLKAALLRDVQSHD